MPHNLYLALKISVGFYFTTFPLSLFCFLKVNETVIEKADIFTDETGFMKT